MTEKYSPEELEARAFAPGWEREAGTDYADYLDALLDPDDPLHDVAVGITSEADSPSGESDDPAARSESVQPPSNERHNSSDD